MFDFFLESPLNPARNDDGGTIVYWREFRNAYCEDRGVSWAHRTRDDSFVEADYDEYGRPLVAMIRESGREVVAINATKMRASRDHGQSPRVNDHALTDDFYRGCLARGPNKTTGFAVWAQGHGTDHVLIKAAHKHRNDGSATRTKGSADATEFATGAGFLSEAAREEIFRNIATKIRDVADRMPEGPPPPAGPPVDGEEPRAVPEGDDRP